jgi:hypothetical protein
MKTLLSTTFILVSMTSANAATIVDRCAPLIANWVNAAPVTCPEPGLADNQTLDVAPLASAQPQASPPAPTPTPTSSD